MVLVNLIVMDQQYIAGIVNADGALWKEQRAFLHCVLRELGAKSLMQGRNGLESKIQVSIYIFLFLFYFIIY